MRVQLEKINEIRQIFYGTFVRFGYKKRHEKTVLLANILDTSSKMMTDHVWFNYTKGFQEAEPLVRGDKVRFCARVKQYRKGSLKRGIPVSYDYRLSHPSKIVKIKKSIKTTPDVKVKEARSKSTITSGKVSPKIKKKVTFSEKVEDDFDLDSFNYKIIMQEPDNTTDNYEDEIDLDEVLEEEHVPMSDDDLSESGIIEYEVDLEEKLIMDHINLAKENVNISQDPVDNFLKKFNCGVIQKDKPPKIIEKKSIATNNSRENSSRENNSRENSSRENSSREKDKFYMKLIEERLEEKFTQPELSKLISTKLPPPITPKKTKFIPPSLYYEARGDSYNLKQSSIQNFVKGKKLTLLSVNKPRKQKMQSRLESFYNY